MYLYQVLDSGEVRDVSFLSHLPSLPHLVTPKAPASRDFESNWPPIRARKMIKEGKRFEKVHRSSRVPAVLGPRGAGEQAKKVSTSWVSQQPGPSKGCPMDSPTLPIGFRWAPLGGSWYTLTNNQLGRSSQHVLGPSGSTWVGGFQQNQFKQCRPGKCPDSGERGTDCSTLKASLPSLSNHGSLLTIHFVELMLKAVTAVIALLLPCTPILASADRSLKEGSAARRARTTSLREGLRCVRTRRVRRTKPSSCAASSHGPNGPCAFRRGRSIHAKETRSKERTSQCQAPAPSIRNTSILQQVPCSDLLAILAL